MLAGHRQRLIRALGLLAGLTAPPALAASVTSAPGRVVQVKSCSVDPADDCWADAATITRFATPQRVAGQPVSARVQLARAEQVLLVKAEQLPEGASLEVIVGRHRTGDPAEAAVLVAGEGLHQLDLGAKKLSGTIRTLSVHLRQDETGTVRTWAPHGHGDLNRPGAAWFSDEAKKADLRITEDEGELHASAPGAAELRIVYRRPLFPAGGRGIPKPWSMQGKSSLGPVQPPQTGWHDVTALWRATSGDVVGLQHRVIYHRAPGEENAEALGIHPEPRRMTQGEGAPFSVRDGTRVCTGQRTWRPVMRLARMELERLTGKELHSRCQLSAMANSIRLVEDKALPAEGFRVRVQTDHVEVAAPDLRGALYGAMAVVDGIGLDGKLQTGEFSDAPAIPWRILHHHLGVNAKAKISPDAWIRFLRRVVTRGRYNTIVLNMSDGYKWASHPELARPNAWSRAELVRLVDAARALGLEVIPGLSEPGHANWITQKHPDLAEDGASYMLCTRHPETRALLAELMSEIIDVFDQPRYIHIGHDELWWPTHRKHEDERCPRCSGSPRWQLVLDHLLWHHAWLKKRGVKPMMWSDMLVKGWHGKNGSIYRAAEGIPEETRADFVVMSWTRVGDTVGTLVPMNFPVVRGHTAYHDWKREGLEEQAMGLTGEALAMFYATPWSTFGGQPGPTSLGSHWSAVILAGATAWRPDLADTNIAPTLDHLAETTAFLPGYRAIPGEPVALLAGGPAAQLDAVLPDQAEVHGASFTVSSPTVFNSQTPMVLPDLGRLEGLSLLQAVAFDRATERRLIRTWRRSNSLNGVRVVRMDITYEDGEKQSSSVRLGMGTDRAERPVRAHFLWRSGGRLRVPSLAAAPLQSGATDRSYSRWDWINPRPETPVREIRFTITDPGVQWQVLGAVRWIPQELIPSRSPE